ncbi:hypothetical protein NLU13_9761 [Sarocladium strictum]|uniref:Uncharacterized protein n=1 Tax=Sarocladium strictum TaxID=5046 RepID=A0AA39GAR5_SARSR|nr:hypothetical protein NLU13_9761 [Sarocladium strictum]
MSIPSSKDRSILPDEMAEATRQTTNMTIPAALFEQLYLAPKTQVKGHLRETFGNPTPIALGGFILTTTPVSMALLGWQGAGGFLAGANAGVFFWLGGIMTLLGAIGEWILGNTFPATVFFTFSCFWLTLSATISPDFNAIGLYSTTTNPADGLAQPQFYSTFSFFLVAMAMVCVVFMVASLRTNIFFFLMFALLVACRKRSPPLTHTCLFFLF